MVVDSRSGSGYADKIEETVIGQIDYCSFVRCSAIFNIQSIHLVIQAVSHFYFQITGEPLFAVGGNIIELHCAFINLNSVPYAGVETGRSSMQGVRSVVDGEFMFFAAVAVTSDSRTQERFGTVDYMVDTVVSENHVGILTVFIRYHNRKNGASVICYSYFHSLLVFEDK